MNDIFIGSRAPGLSWTVKGRLLQGLLASPTVLLPHWGKFHVHSEMFIAHFAFRSIHLEELSKLVCNMANSYSYSMRPEKNIRTLGNSKNGLNRKTIFWQWERIYKLKRNDQLSLEISFSEMLQLEGILICLTDLNEMELVTPIIFQALEFIQWQYNTFIFFFTTYKQKSYNMKRYEPACVSPQYAQWVKDRIVNET